MKLIIFLLLFLNTLTYSQSLWESTSFPDSIPVVSLAFDSGSNIIYAGTTNYYGIYKSTNKGMTWIEINNGISGEMNINDLLVINSQKVFAATSNGLYKSTNQGLFWESVNVGTNGFLYLTTSPKGNIFTAASDGIYRSTDEGENWEKIFYNLVGTIIFDSKCNIYTDMSGAVVYRSFDYGLSWQLLGELKTGTTSHSIDCGLVTKNDNILFGTEDGGVFFSSDYGSTFETKNNGLDYLGISDLLVDAGDHISVITFPDGYYNSIDEAEKWNSFSEGLGNDEPMTVTTDSKGYFYLGSYYGGIYRSKFTLFRFLPMERIKKYYKLPNTFTLDSILIKNESDSVLSVPDVSSSNAVFQLQSQNFSINPNDSIYFVYSYNPTHKGVDIGNITFYNNSIIDSEKVFLKGYSGIPVIQIPFHTLSFGDVELGMTKDTILILRNLGVDTLFIDSIRTSNSVFNYDYENNFILPGDSLLLNLSFTSTSLGYYDSKLILFTNNYSSPDSISLEGYSVPVVGISNKTNRISSFELFQNYPNPFNPSTRIKYSIPNGGKVILKVYDILGKEVATLVNEYKPAGKYEVEFSAEGGSAYGGNASKLPSGIYFYKLKAGNFSQVKKMILLK